MGLKRTDEFRADAVRTQAGRPEFTIQKTCSHTLLRLDGATF